jgi:lysyl-tRNA synthetase class 2
MALIRAVRAYFDGQGFAEVDTPALQACPAMDLHIHAFATEIKGVDLQPKGTLYLHTSPEFAMKKLLVAGLPRLYQICHVYRNAEGSRLHSPEFTMIEWYRAGADYTAIMEDCKGLLRACATALGIGHYRHKGMKCDPFAEWKTVTVEQAFRHYAGLELRAFLPERTEEFRAAIAGKGIRVAPDDSWDDLFFRVMAEKIEPFLGREAPAILCDYPVSMASLSRRKPGDPLLAERFELYVCGIELANAFSELTDAAEQRARFAEEMARKREIYGEVYPADEDFFAALDFGMPESGGIALGIDRLVMLACGADAIEDVLWTAPPG